MKPVGDAGYIDFEEFTQMKSAQGVSVEFLKEIYDKFDLNGDGKLSVPEFSMLLSKHPDLKETENARIRQAHGERADAESGGEEEASFDGESEGTSGGGTDDTGGTGRTVFEGWLYKRGAELTFGGNPGYKKRWFGGLLTCVV